MKFLRKAAHKFNRCLMSMALISLSVVQPVLGAVSTPSSSAITISSTASEVSSQSSRIILAPNTKYATEMYIISSGVPGPTVLITGGVHGNEKAGYMAADQVKNTRISKGTLLVIPYANKLADNNNSRAIKGEKDLNRAFPTSKSSQPSYPLARAIYDVARQYKVNWVMDMHEGYGYSASGSSSVGQSLIYYPGSACTTMAKKILSTVNAGINVSSHRFKALRYPVAGSLARSTAQYLGANSFIFETCTRDSLKTRINNQLLAADTLLRELNMK